MNKKKSNNLINPSKNEYPPLHKSVLVNEVLEHLNIKPNGVYVDVTFGCGGHTRAILEKEPTAKVIAIDWDKKSLDIFAPQFKEKYQDRFQAIWGSFSQIYKLLKNAHIENVDGILADFGTSQLQIETIEGLSFKKDSPLDMRMSKAHNYFDAAYIINRYSEKELAKIFFEFGEEHQARKIAQAIIQNRKKAPIKTTTQLAKIVINAICKVESKKRYLHPATKVFQALRIYINKELKNIELFLPSALHFLKSGGRLVCISFHSLEDRIVKDFFRSNQHQLKIITPKPVTPTLEEVKINASARSSKLRAAEKLNA